MGRLLFTGALILALAGRSSAEIINGDFETGDLTGWDVFINGPTISADVQDFGGNKKLVIDFSNGGNGDVAIVSQQINIVGTKQVLFSFDYEGAVTSPFPTEPDSGGLTTYFLGAGAIDVKAAIDGTVQPGQTVSFGPATFSAVLPPGAYIVAVNVGIDIGPVSGQFVIDNFQFTPVPEPSSAVLLSIGGALASLCVLRSQSRRSRSD